MVFAPQRAGVFAARIDRQGLPAFVARLCDLHYRLIDKISTTSPYLGLAQLPAGHLLQIAAGKAVNVRCYWALNEAEEWQADEVALAEQYREMLFRAVNRRLSIASRPDRQSTRLNYSTYCATRRTTSGCKKKTKRRRTQ